ncbi:S8 family serine peptidase [Pelomonas sp. CA6]|uniref:S8 family serine peptidase n=1 Tax=Pelomonas sp. CA6 TaxID=2907999 RepID=UPI001F4BEEEE|nr:S8 family serine peptidase [Pelomonas sp. CA6]MCH7343411.1 S8 family serine peptidase [Pelomonas sp. CA6]
MLLAALIGVMGGALPAQAADAEGRVIVRFKESAQSVRAQALGHASTVGEARQVAQLRADAMGLRQGLALRARLSLDERTHALSVSGLGSDELARRLARDPEVEWVDVDHRRRRALLPNDPLYATALPSGPEAGQWYLKPPGATVVSSINAPAAWDLTTGSSSVVVAVLDTGIRKDHPDLTGKIVGGYDFVAYQNGSIAQANDGDGADPDASDPGDWVDQADLNAGGLGSGCTSSDIANSSWHGTRVAGLIGAASNNGLGMAGVAWGARILPVRVLGKCGGWDSEIQAGMRWAAGLAVPGVPTNPNPARILNLSLGGGGSCGASYQSTVSAVVAQGALIVAAAGNGQETPGNQGGVAVTAPANCAAFSSGVIAVAALRHAGTKVGFSNLGPEVTLSAPGGNCVNVDANGNATGPCLYPMLATSNSGSKAPVAADNAYNYGGVGTSFATPLVSGTAALMLSADPTLTPARLTQLLRGSARAFVTSGAGGSVPQCRAPSSTAQLECYCTTSTCGAGMLDAAAAVQAAAAVSTPTATITASASTVQTGASITLSGSGSVAAGGRSIASYQWSITNGSGSATLSASNGASVTLSGGSAGTVTVRLTVTDSLGVSASQDLVLTISATPVSNVSSGGSSGGGGGLAHPGWLLALALAALALGRPGRPSAGAASAHGA